MSLVSEEVIQYLVDPTEEEENISVAEVRRCLSFIRKSWEEVQNNDTHKPLYQCESLKINQKFTLSEFALKFVLSHHSKRVSKKEKS